MGLGELGAFSSAPRLNYRRIMGQIENPEVVRKMETIAEYLEKKGRRVGHLKGRLEGRLEGRQEGRLEGRMEGRQEGLVESIMAFLTARFGGSAAKLAEPLGRIESFAALTKLLLLAPEAKSVREFERALQQGLNQTPPTPHQAENAPTRRPKSDKP